MSFTDFWARYPRRESKKDALKAWTQLNPSPALEQQILEALAWQVEKPDWIKDDGQFIPLPGSWIRGERWTDERRGRDRRASPNGILYECPHEPACETRWICGSRQLRERAS